MGYLGPHEYLYMEISCMTHKIKRITRPYLSHMKRHPKILETPCAKLSQQGKAPTLKGFRFTTRYYISTRPPPFTGTQEIPSSLTIKFLEISFTNLTFEGFLAGTTSVPSVWSICSSSTGTHWSDLELTTH